MPVWLVIILLGAALPAVADEQIRILEKRELPAGQAGAGASYRLDLSVHRFQGGRWSEEEIAAAVAQAGELLRQCDVAVTRAELRVVQAPPRFRVYFTPLSRELVARLAAPKPALFFVDDTRNDPAFDAEAIGRANAASRPELADTVWVAYGARDVPQALAHELVHLLSDSGVHSDVPGNLMRPETAPGNTRLAPEQCARLRAKGAAKGLLRVN